MNSLGRSVRHWWPPLTVSFAVNSLLLSLIGMRLAPGAPLALDTVVSVELVAPAPAAPRSRAVIERRASRTPALPRPPLRPAPSPVAPEAAPSSPGTSTEPAPEQAPDTADPAPADIEPLWRVTQLPAFRRRVEPIYPETERAQERQARVVAQVVIDDQGQVSHVDIVASGGPAFDAAVIEALRRSRFSPAYVGGRAVSVRLTVPFQFKLE